MNSFSGIKDIDRHILSFLSDKDLLKCSLLNKYLYYFVCDDNFFYRILEMKYPHTLISKIREKYFIQKYKHYYLRMIYYISKMEEEYDYFYISGDPEKQYGMFKYSENFDQLLEKSCARGELGLVKEAIKRGADIHLYNGRYLVLAARYGYLEIIKYLVSLGADIHADDEGSLRIASYDGHLEIVKYCVNLGANIHVNNDEPLRWANEAHRLEIVNYLKSL